MDLKTRLSSHFDLMGFEADWSEFWELVIGPEVPSSKLELPRLSNLVCMYVRGETRKFDRLALI